MPFGIGDLLGLSQGGVWGIDETPYSPITFPLELPAPVQAGNAVSPRRVVFRSMNATVATQSSFTYKSQIQSLNADMWIVDITFPPMERDAAEELIAFLLTLQGQKGTFLIGDPLGRLPRGVATGTPLVRDSNQTGRILTTQGWTPDTADILKAGDWIGIGQRGYKVLRNVDSNSAGEATLDIYPMLRETPAAGDPILTEDVKILMRLNSSAYDVWNADETRTYGLSFSAQEALS